MYNVDNNDFYTKATSRNIGLITEEEQEVLKKSRVAIAGMGAVGGHYAVTLARMGVGHFTIADGDTFEPANIHRQAGAFVHTMGRNKAEAMAEMVKSINPDADVRVIPQHLTEENIDRFLDGADMVLDGIDFFQIDARRLIFRKAREKGLFAITSGPVGYGATLQIFDPDGMEFDEYFGIRPGMTRAERLACFIVGLLPRLPKPGKHQMDISRVDFRGEKGPALASSIMLCAGIMSTEAMRILLKRDKPLCVPHAFYFNAESHDYSHSCVRKGRCRLLDRLARHILFRRMPGLRRLHDEETQALATPPLGAMGQLPELS